MKLERISFTILFNFKILKVSNHVYNGNYNIMILSIYSTNFDGRCIILLFRSASTIKNIQKLINSGFMNVTLFITSNKTQIYFQFT